jgi:two-component system, NarL family, sensor histidine kinase EvgS
MDIIMPVMGGYQASLAIRKLEDEYGLSSIEKHFICGFSAEVHPDIVKKCKDAGMDDILPKPMSATALQELLQRNKRETNLIRKKSVI